MTKKNFYCERLNVEEQSELSGGDTSRGGTDAGGPTSGGNAACICACYSESNDEFWDGVKDGFSLIARIILGI